MYMSATRANEVSGAVFMIGLGLLFVVGFWPGIMFVIGATSIVQGLAEGRGWYAFQGAIWTIGVGVWALLGYNLAALFVAVGVSMLIAALVKPPFLAPKPKVDNYLD